MNQQKADEIMRRATSMMDRASEESSTKGDNSYSHYLQDNSERLINYVEDKMGANYSREYWQRT